MKTKIKLNPVFKGTTNPQDGSRAREIKALRQRLPIKGDLVMCRINNHKSHAQVESNKDPRMQAPWIVEGWSTLYFRLRSTIDPETMIRALKIEDPGNGSEYTWYPIE